MESGLKWPELPCASCGKRVPVMLKTFRVHCGVCIHTSRGRVSNCLVCEKPLYTEKSRMCYLCSHTDCTLGVFDPAGVS